MSLKNQKKAQPLKVAKTEEELSNDRQFKLEEKVFDAINKVSKEIDGDFTVYEIVSVLTKITHNYNKRGLAYQFEERSEKPTATPDK